MNQKTQKKLQRIDFKNKNQKRIKMKLKTFDIMIIDDEFLLMSIPYFQQPNESKRPKIVTIN